MKIARFDNSGRPEIGLIVDGCIIPMNDHGLGDDMVTLISNWDKYKSGLEELVKNTELAVPLDKASLLAPIARPGKILAIGLNYGDHIAETGLDKPEQQLWFAKMGSSAHPPFADVQLPKASTQVDYEVEMVAVIGKGGRHIPAETARDHVFGYCVGNDVSVRDWQMSSPQWLLGKSFDTHAPFGPWITTDDAVEDPHGLDIQCLVNGELRQSSNTGHLVFQLWEQISHLSKAMTLEPGDLIFSGTPGGVGIAMKPPHFLKAGDVVKCEIGTLGAIENRFMPES